MVLEFIKVLKIEEEIANYGERKRKVFLSYSWKDEELVNKIEDKFNKKGMKLVRDKHDLQYKKSIKEFMKKIRIMDYVLIVISDDYLKSENCMYEIAEFTKDENYKERILPIVRNNANIFDDIGRIKYSKYWQNKYNDLLNQVHDLDELSRIPVLKTLIRFEKIKRDLPDFLSNISDMNLITCDDELE